MLNFKGSITALITPMLKDKELDIKSLKDFIDFQICSGTHGLLVLGTTGESATLSIRERQQVIDIAIDVNNNRVPIMVGSGTNNTMESIEYTRYAKEAGADASLVVVPYYSKPNQRGIYEHFKKIGLETNFPICIYNIPSRTVVSMEKEIFKKLSSENPEIFFAMKDSTGSPDFSREVLSVVNKDFIILCGDDILYKDYIKNGSIGCISVISNIFPDICSAMNNSILSNDVSSFNEIHNMLLELSEALFLEPNPCPVKYAAMKLGIIKTDEVRLPMTKISLNTANKIDIILTRIKGI